MLAISQIKKRWLIFSLLLLSVTFADAEPMDLAAVLQKASKNNPTLKASYASVDVAQAKVRQAGILENPRLGVKVAWPSHSSSGPTQEYMLSYNIIDLFGRSSRKDIAKLRRDAVLLEALHQAIDIEAEIKDAYYTVQGHSQALKEQQTLLKIAEIDVQLAERQREAGNIPAIVLAQKRAKYVETRIKLYDREQSLFEERQRLARLVGEAENGHALSIVTELDELPTADNESLEESLATALDNRPDLGATEYELAALEKDLRLQNLLIFDGTEVGYVYEREINEVPVQGFSLSVPVPIFDRRQGQKDELSAELRKKQAQQEELFQQVITEVKTLLVRMANARLRVEQLEQLVPLRQEILEQSQLQYNAMLIGTYDLLYSRGDSSLAVMTLADAKADYWRARAALESALSHSVLKGSVPYELLSKGSF